MNSLTEKLAFRHISDVPDLKIQRLAGGISSEIYKVEAQSQTDNHLLPFALTILRDPEEWWKLEKEQEIRTLVGNDPEVLLPALIDLGLDEIDGKRVAFIISEFIVGGDLDAFLEQELTETTIHKLSDLAFDLGYRIGALHSHDAGIYGLIGFTPDQHSSWHKYILNQFDREFQYIHQLSPSLKIGSVTIFELQNSLKSIEELVGQYQSTLQSDDSRLAHGDARFGNFIASSNQGNEWKVKSMIDLEAMIGGDPEIDIAFMENWLHFSSYKTEFFSQKANFLGGYEKMRTPSLNYDKKRFIYHAIRSLAYLRTVFNFDINEFVQANPLHVGYVEQHMQIVQSLARGNYLEDIGLESLV